jgi:hypothetical protein
MIYRSPEEMKDLISQLDDKGNDFWDAELARVKLDILRQASVQPKAVDALQAELDRERSRAATLKKRLGELESSSEPWWQRILRP